MQQTEVPRYNYTQYINSAGNIEINGVNLNSVSHILIQCAVRNDEDQE